MMSLYRLIRRFWHSTVGHAAVEFAIIIPIILLLLVAVADLGTGFITKINVQSAVNSGLQHAIQTGGSNIGQTQQIIAYELNTPSVPAQISVEKTCRCSANPIACTNSCATGVKQYVLASASLPYSTPVMGVNMPVSADFELFVGYK